MKKLVCVSTCMQASKQVLQCSVHNIWNSLYYACVNVAVPCHVESCPTPGDNRGSTSRFGSISGVPSHAVNERSF